MQILIASGLLAAFLIFLRAIMLYLKMLRQQVLPQRRHLPPVGRRSWR